MMQNEAQAHDGLLDYSVVVPVYRSEKILPELHRRLTEVMRQLDSTYEIIFVDDCGPDRAWSVLEQLARDDVRVVAIQLMRNSGQSNATLCGLAHTRGERVLTLDDDLQHPPEEIPRLIEALLPNVDVVMGVPKEKRHHWFRRLGSSLMHEVNCYLLGKDPHLRFTSLRLMRRAVVDGLLKLRTLSPALGPMINSVTHRIVNTTVEHASRLEGRSGYTFRRLLSQTMSNLIGYSMLPLRLLALMGALGIVLSAIFAAILIVRYLTGGINVPGWTTIALLLVLISGFNFFAFAIIGEYVLRILQRVNATPQYFVRSRITQARDEEGRNAVG
ncbi:Undecaprenyl-phosphate 4-deoxy-4-formamido-L-arabinose transferase [Thiorhodovibrio winogradskyi]|uniref:Undecaprenyl-phosphate 4-deoxy-4-formamido-L-arabinose transferase n=2 Tax=Thiorhodovibrio winogradskyi TaxID=77007 RepID=A0ABZ0SBN0_9GAMM